MNNEEYRRITDNLLEGVRIKTDWDGSVVPVYESEVPHISVPGCLEFVGLYHTVEKLMERRLSVYVDGFDGKFIDDLFAGSSDIERLSLLQSCDSVILGVAAMTLRYYHPGRMKSKGIQIGVEYNGILSADEICSIYENEPLSPELRDEMGTIFEQGKDQNFERKRQIELKILAELAERVKQGFQIGRKK